jgi:hypothetical protein
MEVEIARLEFEQIFNSVGDTTWVINEGHGVVRLKWIDPGSPVFFLTKFFPLTPSD